MSRLPGPVSHCWPREMSASKIGYGLRKICQESGTSKVPFHGNFRFTCSATDSRHPVPRPNRSCRNASAHGGTASHRVSWLSVPIYTAMRWQSRQKVQRRRSDFPHDTEEIHAVAVPATPRLKWLRNKAKRDASCIVLVHGHKCPLRLAMHLEVSLFHPAMIAVVHPIGALGRLAVVEAVVP